MAFDYTGMISTALSLIDKFGMTATLRQVIDGAPSDPLKPWIPSSPTNNDTAVRMAFLPEEHINRYFQMRIPEELVGEGLEYALMGDNGVEPSKKHLIIRGSEQLRVNYINKIAPSGQPVLYIIGVLR